jgi:hypothetical protein
MYKNMISKTDMVNLKKDLKSKSFRKNLRTYLEFVKFNRDRFSDLLKEVPPSENHQHPSQQSDLGKDDFSS